jgi:hypothetical protein
LAATSQSVWASGWLASQSSGRVSDFAPSIRTAAMLLLPEGNFQHFTYNSFHYGMDQYVTKNDDNRYNRSDGCVALHKEA